MESDGQEAGGGKPPHCSKAISSLSFHLSHIGDFIWTRLRPPCRYQRDHLHLKLNDSNKRCALPFLSPRDPHDPSAPWAARGAEVWARARRIGHGNKKEMSRNELRHAENCRRRRRQIHTATPHRYAHTAGTKSDTHTLSHWLSLSHFFPRVFSSSLT